MAEGANAQRRGRPRSFSVWIVAISAGVMPSPLSALEVHARRRAVGLVWVKCWVWGPASSEDDKPAPFLRELPMVRLAGS